MDTSELSSSLCSAISKLHKRLRKKLYSTNAFSLTEIETIGHLLRSGSLLPSELAVLTRITTQSMSQSLKKMEKFGVISRSPSQEDKRKVYISLTDFGKGIIETVKAERNEWLKTAIESVLTEQEKETLERSLPILNKLKDV